MENINIYQLQAQASRIAKEASRGKTFQVLRYSKPVAIVMPFKEYEKLRGECRECLEHWRRVTGAKLSRASK